jgi:hypothetical protein
MNNSTSLNALLAEIESFITAKRMSPTEFGETVMNDSRFVHEIRDGRRKTVTLDTADKCRDFIVNYPG